MKMAHPPLLPIMSNSSITYYSEIYLGFNQVSCIQVTSGASSKLPFNYMHLHVLHALHVLLALQLHAFL